MAAKANQIIAIEKGIKSTAHSEGSELYKIVQKPELFEGLKKEYQSNAEDGDKLPPESKRVQYTVDDVLRRLTRYTGELLTVTARKDWTNTVAKADVVVDGNVLLKDVPISYLLFLEKQLTDLNTFIAKLPVLDEAQDWTKDEASGLQKSGVTETHRTKKIQKAIVLYPATDKHPAQTHLATEDVVEGYWKTQRMSGAIAKTLRQEYIDKGEKLLIAVKEAREAANMQEEIPSPADIGDTLFNFVFGE